MAEQAAEHLMQENAALSERLAALEFALESMDWRLLTMQAEQEFSREGLRIIAELARVMYLKSPLIKRGVNVQGLYVWGQGWSVRAKDAAINAVIQVFIDDRGNAAELTGHQGRMQKEVELSTDGNLFLVLFTNPVTGRVRVRSTCWSSSRSVRSLTMQPAARVTVAPTSITRLRVMCCCVSCAASATDHKAGKTSSQMPIGLSRRMSWRSGCIGRVISGCFGLVY